MTNLKKQIFSVMTAGALVLSVSAPAFAGTTIEISGNGAGSDNSTQVTQSNTNTVTQNNDAHVDNHVDSNANSGNNKADFNTGGDVTVNTGTAKTDTNVTNTLNSNTAQTGCSACQTGNTDVTVNGNGAGSQNQVKLTDYNTTRVTQDNHAGVWNSVDSNADSGSNKANSNTGGTVTVNTGVAKAITNVSTSANANNAVVGNVGAGAQNPTATFKIANNGAGSTNFITGTLSQGATVTQDNGAWIGNHVDSDANSGHNSADFNGGSVTINTGAAKTETDVDNMANFNNASLNCGCGFDVTAKVVDNGAGFFNNGQNGILLDLNNSSVVGQGNHADLHNWLDDQDANSGFNHASLNTGTVNTDPSVVTGSANTDTTVHNNANVNTVGNVLPINWPSFGDINVGANFDVSAFLAMLGLHIS